MNASVDAGVLVCCDGTFEDILIQRICCYGEEGRRGEGRGVEGGEEEGRGGGKGREGEGRVGD